MCKFQQCLQYTRLIRFFKRHFEKNKNKKNKRHLEIALNFELSANLQSNG